MGWFSTQITFVFMSVFFPVHIRFKCIYLFGEVVEYNVCFILIFLEVPWHAISFLKKKTKS